MGLLWSIVMPISILVTVVYWTVLDPFWKAEHVQWNSICEHLVNTLLLLVELIVSRNVFYLRHAGAVYTYGIIYLVWSLIDFWALVTEMDATSAMPIGMIVQSIQFLI